MVTICKTGRIVDFVLKNFERMEGGETFIPKIPSVKIVDLAKAMAPNSPIKIIGIRPGEKIHEIMCPKDDAHNTFEYEDHYVISPSINFDDKESDYSKNAIGEKGKKVDKDFEFNSGNNESFLDEEGILELDRMA